MTDNNKQDIFDQLATPASGSTAAMAPTSAISAPASVNATAKPSAAPKPKGDVFDQIATGTLPQSTTTTAPDDQPYLPRIISGIGQSLKNTFVRPVKASTIGTPLQPQNATEHVIQTLVGDEPFNAYRAAKAIVESGQNIGKAAGEAYPKAIRDFRQAYDQFKSGDYRNAAISGAETVGDAATIVDPTSAGGSGNWRELAEGLRPGHDLVTPFARQATDAGTFLVAEKAPEAAEYSPRKFVGGKVEGAPRPANLAQGAINKSVGAAVRDVRYGDPSKALIDEGISAPTTLGRQKAVGQKISEIKPQLDAALDSATMRINLHDVLTQTLDEFTKKLDDAMMSPEERQAANDEVAIAEERIGKYADHKGTISAREANDAKQEVGNRVGDWEKRPTPVSDLVQQTYHKLYGDLKNAVNEAAGTAALNERMSNLLSLKKALAEKGLRNAVAPNTVGSKVADVVMNTAGHVAPAAIKGAQTAAQVAQGSVPASVLAQEADPNSEFNGGPNANP
jgi:hypothetical protein